MLLCCIFSTKEILGWWICKLAFHQALTSHALGFCLAAVCVLDHMLLLDPDCRVAASEALTLPYFSEFREPEEETEAQPYDHSMDHADLTLEQWKRKGGIETDRGGRKRQIWRKGMDERKAME